MTVCFLCNSSIIDCNDKYYIGSVEVCKTCFRLHENVINDSTITDEIKQQYMDKIDETFAAFRLHRAAVANTNLWKALSRFNAIR